MREISAVEPAQKMKNGILMLLDQRKNNQSDDLDLKTAPTRSVHVLELIFK
jgi:hypothetical protein